jgi:hypothetical protein
LKIVNKVSRSDLSLFLKHLSGKKVEGGYRIDKQKKRLDFNPSTKFTCPRITFYSSTLKINNFCLCGSLKFYKCNIIISVCKFTPSDYEKEVVLYADDSSQIKLLNVSIDARDLIGVLSSIILFQKLLIVSFLIFLLVLLGNIQNHW